MLQRINLVPQTPLSAKIKRITPVFLFIFLGVILCFLYINNSQLGLQIDKVTQEITEQKNRMSHENQLLERVAGLKGSVKNLREKKKEFQSKVTTLENFKQEKWLYSEIFAMITEVIPSSVIFDKMSLRDKAGVIKGRSLDYEDLTDMVKKMKNKALITSVILQDVERNPAGEHGLLSFTISFELS